jgi:riboflavin kinase / FMN adenylyltransferase
MLIARSIEELSPFDKPCSITIGVFDGLHLGHQHLLKNLEFEDQKKVVITFNNQEKHPDPLKKKLCTLEHRLDLLKNHGIDMTLVLDFTKKLAATSYKDFLISLKTHLNFSHLVLGEDAVFGYNKLGFKKNVENVQDFLNFEVSYIPKINLNNQIISTTNIKNLINKAQIEKAEKFLGRPYELLIKPSDISFSSFLGSKTLCIKLEDILLPPDGLYLFKIDKFEPIFQGKIQKSQIEIYIKNISISTCENFKLRIYKKTV